MRRAALVLALMLASQSASAEYETGEKLQALCRPKIKSDFGDGYAIGYVVGVAAHAQSVDVGQKYFCVPPGIIAAQVHGVVCRWLNVMSPERLRLPADRLVIRALSETLPCPKR